MKLNAPKSLTFLISIILIVGGIACFYVDSIPVNMQISYLITLAGSLVLILGNLLKGL
jgi:hypothetical protein